MRIDITSSETEIKQSIQYVDGTQVKKKYI